MTAFRRRDAVAGCIAIGLLPFFENLVTDRVLYEQVGSLAYNSSPMHFLGFILFAVWLFTDYWFCTRTFTSGIWWFKRDENTRLRPEGQRTYWLCGGVSAALSLVCVGMLLWSGRWWGALLLPLTLALLWMGWKILFRPAVE